MAMVDLSRMAVLPSSSLSMNSYSPCSTRTSSVSARVYGFWFDPLYGNGNGNGISFVQREGKSLTTKIDEKRKLRQNFRTRNIVRNAVRNVVRIYAQSVTSVHTMEASSEVFVEKSFETSEEDSFNLRPLVNIYDTTLRDGAQMVGISLSVSDKIKIAQILVDLGVEYIEGGWPGSNPKDAEFFSRWGDVIGENFEKQKKKVFTKLAAFGSTRHKSTTCETDSNVAALLDSGAPVVTLVAKAWDQQVERVLGASLEENLRMISDTVSYFKKHGREVMLDAEHYFDGYKSNPEYAIKCLQEAAKSGADVVVLCDTNGGSMPWEVEEMTREAVASLRNYYRGGRERQREREGEREGQIKGEIEGEIEREGEGEGEREGEIQGEGEIEGEGEREGEGVRVGVHSHNDCGMAVANSVAAVRGGARMVQGCVNGYGERTGNANLISVIGTLQVKLGYKCISPSSLKKVTEASLSIAELANLPSSPSQPFVGASAFAHKGGIHVAAIRKMPESYNHMDPSLVGNSMRSVVSELSGRGNILDKMEKSGLVLDREIAGNVLARIKQMESEGCAFEGASASVDMLIVRRGKDYKQPFKVVEFSIICSNRGPPGETNRGEGGGEGEKNVLQERSNNQAIVKVQVDGKDQMTASEGNGPVDALSHALRSALEVHYPQLSTVELKDYRVRLVEPTERRMGTMSTTRVTIDFSDQRGNKWTTVGAHTSIVEASFAAIVDGLEFGIANCSEEGCKINH